MNMTARLALPVGTLTALALSSIVVAQVAPPPSATESAASKGETTVLSAFEVVSDPVGTYEAINFTSLTGSNKPLAKLPVTAEILTEQAIADLAITNPMDALRDFATGIGAPYTQAGSATQAGAAGDNVIVGNFKLRGLAAGVPLRNGFMDVRQGVTPFEGLNMSRIEVIRGPQALLYGPGSPGGVLNIVTKKASFGSNKGSVELRADDNGSLRASLDGNYSRPLFGRRAAVRVAAVRDNANYWRTNSGQDTKGHYVEAGIELLKPTATTLRFEYEEMRVDRTFSTGSTITAMPTVAPNNTLVRLLLAEGSPALSQVYNGGITWENVDSFGTTSAGRWDKHSYIAWTLSSKLTPWLQAQVQAGRDILNFSVMNPNNSALRAPGVGGNPFNEWAVMYTVAGPRVHMANDAVRATFTADFNLTRFTKNNLVFGAEMKRGTEFNLQRTFFEVDANGNFVVNPAQINNAMGGRNAMPAEWVSVERGREGYVHVTDLEYTHSNGRKYRRDFNRYTLPSLVTPDNPEGWTGGPAGLANGESRTRGLFAALFTDWFKGKVDTMASIRIDDSTAFEKNINRRTEYPFDGTNAYNLGAVWHALPYLSPYVGWSTRTKLQGGYDFRRQPLPLGKGVSLEYGAKFSAFNGRISGSAAIFKNTAQDEAAIIDGVTAGIMNPNSFINGRLTEADRFSFDPEARGFEIALTAQPMRNWRLQFSYSHFNGEQGDDVYLPIYYNDQFRTNAGGQVTLADGTPLRVPVDPRVPVASDGRTYAANVATQVLTVNTLRTGDASGNYRADLDPVTGRILNSQLIGLTVPGVGTGEVGLPITQHQLGFRPPTGENFLARKGGDRLIGAPRHALSILSVYRFRSGLLQGASAGFSTQYRTGEIAYYYTDNADGGKRKLLSFPDAVSVNLIAGYERKLTERINWRLQLNVNNIFDEQVLRFYPNLANGTPLNAVLTGTPRTFIVTNTFSF